MVLNYGLTGPSNLSIAWHTSIPLVHCMYRRVPSFAMLERHPPLRPPCIFHTHHTHNTHCTHYTHRLGLIANYSIPVFAFACLWLLLLFRFPLAVTPLASLQPTQI